MTIGVILGMQKSGPGVARFLFLRASGRASGGGIGGEDPPVDQALRG